MSTPRVVRAAPSDAEVFAALLAANRSAYDAREELGRAHAVVWITYTPDGSAGGFLLAWEIVDELEILDVFVLPSARRHGLGSALMTQALAHAREAGKQRALLEVRTSNQPARRLYQKLGFAEVGERKAYYADGEDALLLELRL